MQELTKYVPRNGSPPIGYFLLPIAPSLVVTEQEMLDLHAELLSELYHHGAGVPEFIFSLPAGRSESRHAEWFVTRRAILNLISRTVITGQDIYFSISHTRHQAVVAFSKQPIGVDLEFRERKISDKASQRLGYREGLGISPMELWCLKESIFKIAGPDCVAISQIEVKPSEISHGCFEGWFQADIFCAELLPTPRHYLSIAIKNQ